MFFRLQTDGSQDPVNLTHLYSSPTPAACWIVGGGSSLQAIPSEELINSPCPKFGINLSGSGVLRPTFWTSYDPTVRFQKSIYLDSSILKFVHRSRAMDLVPETTFKVCDCPATLFFERHRQNSFRNFTNFHNAKVGDWQDSMLQAIHIACGLGFRKLYLIGCEMHIRPSSAQLQCAAQRGVQYHERELLGRFVDRCVKQGIKIEELEELQTGPQYHFDESKALTAAIQTDFHYFRVAQYLRLARRSLATTGLQLISATPHSRLNDYFPVRTFSSVIDELHESIGNPAQETTRGRYLESADRFPADLGPMRDFCPHFQEATPTGPKKDRPQTREKPLPVPRLPDIPVDLRENP